MAPATLPLFSISGASRSSTTNALPFAIISRACTFNAKRIYRVLKAFEHRIERNEGIIYFIDDPEGAKKWQRENPDAVVIQWITIDPAICEHRPCKDRKNPASTCPQNYLLPLAEQNIRDMPYRWMYTRWEN